MRNILVSSSDELQLLLMLPPAMLPCFMGKLEKTSETNIKKKSAFKRDYYYWLCHNFEAFYCQISHKPQSGIKRFFQSLSNFVVLLTAHWEIEAQLTVKNKILNPLTV